MLLLCLSEVICFSVSKNIRRPTRLSQGTASSLQYNVSSKSILTTSGAFPRYENSSISSKTFPTAPSAHIYTVNNDTVVTNTSSLSACCFVVQDTIDARYWAGKFTKNIMDGLLLTTRNRRLPHLYHSHLESNNVFDHVRY